MLALGSNSNGIGGNLSNEFATLGIQSGLNGNEGQTIEKLIQNLKQ